MSDPGTDGFMAAGYVPGNVMSFANFCHENRQDRKGIFAPALNF